MNSKQAIKTPKNSMFSLPKQYDTRFKPFRYIYTPFFYSYDTFSSQVVNMRSDLQSFVNDFKALRKLIDNWADRPCPKTLDGTNLNIILELKAVNNINQRLTF